MTTTPHGQVPDALIDLIDAYAETRHRCGGIYNARTEAARKAVIEALSGVQALSAAPEAAPRIFLVTEHYSKDGRLKPVYGSSLRKILSGHSTLNSAECARAEAEDAYNVLYPGYRQYGNQLPYAWVVQEVEVMPNTASPTPPEEQQAEESRVKLLAECRDAFPIPEPSSPLEVQWAAAMARPEEVPEYVRLCVAAMQAAPKAAPATVSRTQHSQFLSDVLTAAGLITHGKQCKALGERLADMVMRLREAPQQEAQGPFAWESTTPGYIKYITQAQYEKFSPNVQRWYKPYKCSSCAAPQQEAQKPVATLHCNDIGYVWARATEVGTRMRFEQPINLYTAPQPAPAPLSDDVVKDAARYRWLRTNLAGIPEETDAAIDATIAAHGGK